jgi:hypothetical protein
MNAREFLLNKIIRHRENGLDNLGHLEAKFVDNLSIIMQEFAEDAIFEAFKRLNKGEEIEVRGKILSIKK